ncbi:MAG: helix-hairpin-helix domain-containing protein [Phycisphaerales bacterium]|nr:helix-hairpin-helix domain-containing protein [Phycisphaerales bacterium]
MARGGPHRSSIASAAAAILVSSCAVSWWGLSASRSQHAAPLPPRRVDVNRADAAELALLPGIGPRLAARIVDDRQRRGPFESLDELDRVAGIGPRTILRMAPLAEAGDKGAGGPASGSDRAASPVGDRAD